MDRMSGKVAVITGGARGQGRAHAVRLAAEGAEIAITDACAQYPDVPYPMGTVDELAETVAAVEALGRRCLSFKADARDPAAMRAVMADTVAELGHIDTVVINHGITIPHTVEGPEAEDAIWDLIIDTNLSGVWRTARAAVPHLRDNGGSITVTASSAALTGLFNQAAYVSAKWGLIGMVKTLAAELAHYWIRANAVCPCAVATPLFLNPHHVRAFCGDDPTKTIEDMEWPATSLNLLPVPWIEPEAVASAVLYLASEEAKYVTGIALPVDAGTSIQPPGITPFVGTRLWELQQQVPSLGA
ncbi:MULTISPECIES: mycofactocin-coupled SDR family oxidoreductase [unclassified Pseudofrankia]|uniref:mycofactocin-coupled SDR family oxidoreductase n=1 Tax=unclassified Pseudofrankia TaxID=2994372 RepID=UPI0008D97B93|nr:MULTISPECIES: mycofactocin-coupled SDR family oxidoreductase [unclassified Pseudofrankia]MDT3444686.1 mycofactocin-coupled SDR family oxidoreductase [Pseudofrankia sp. BMG5.37]OHV66575.1 hypothetical protein BCD48_35830 [Pseudofrankia sp. BMG5.36]